MASCYHCGLPADDEFQASVNQCNRDFCCYGCQAITLAIVDGGLENFYQFRDAKNEKARTQDLRFEVYDVEALQEDFVSPLRGDLYEAMLSISGITCAACAWLIEERLSKFDDVLEVSVNASNYRCRVVWRKASLPLSKIFSALAEVGYVALPGDTTNEQARRDLESRKALMRLGVAGIGMMQVGMYAIALHAGAFQGMENDWRQFFRFISLIVATPIVFYSARPFFDNAFRALKAKRLNMDVPVALAIGLAFCASLFATLRNTGEVYFDSVSMFTFFLLLGRYLEMRARHSSAFFAESMSQLLPLSAERHSNDSFEVVPLKMLVKGDKVRVQPGAVIPCDGVVVEGESGVDESILNGESMPRSVNAGSQVFAGTKNADTQLLVSVDATGKETRLASVESLVDRAMTSKPKIVQSVDRLASYFVLSVILVSVLAGTYWYFESPDKVLWVMLSVLVATCPCALSLATPAALTAGTLAMRKLGVLISSQDFIEKMGGINYVVFDKTGTLTRGELVIDEVRQLSSCTEKEILSIVAALESHSRHPIAKAFASQQFSAPASKVKVVPGKGIEGEVAGCRYRFGVSDFSFPDDPLAYPGEGLWQLLSDDENPLAWILFKDQPREGIPELISFFDEKTIAREVVSGDRRENVALFCAPYGLTFQAAVSPEDKLLRVEDLKSSGKKVLMLGDGINDVPVLSAADLAIAVGDATRLAQTHADAVLLTESLSPIEESFSLASAVRRKIKQNYLWALFYNLAILPLAVCAMLPPYLAAIGMSLSSLVVVLNAMTLQRFRPKSDD